MSLIKKLAEKVLTTIGQRGEQNGYDKQAGTAQEERSAAQIARVFNALTGHNLSTTDAWTFQQVLKLVRMENQIKMGSGDLLDSCVDMVGYSLLKAETALQDHRPAQAGELVKREPETQQERLATARRIAGCSDTDAVATTLPTHTRVGRRVDTGSHPVVLPEETFKAIDDAKHTDGRS